MVKILKKTIIILLYSIFIFHCMKLRIGLCDFFLHTLPPGHPVYHTHARAHAHIDMDKKRQKRIKRKKVLVNNIYNHIIHDTGMYKLDQFSGAPKRERVDDDDEPLFLDVAIIPHDVLILMLTHANSIKDVVNLCCSRRAWTSLLQTDALVQAMKGRYEYELRPYSYRDCEVPPAKFDQFLLTCRENKTPLYRCISLMENTNTMHYFSVKNRLGTFCRLDYIYLKLGERNPRIVSVLDYITEHDPQLLCIHTRLHPLNPEEFDINTLDLTYFKKQSFKVVNTSADLSDPKWDFIGYENCFLTDGKEIYSIESYLRVKKRIEESSIWTLSKNYDHDLTLTLTLTGTNLRKDPVDYTYTPSFSAIRRMIRILSEV